MVEEGLACGPAKADDKTDHDELMVIARGTLR